MRFSHFLKYNAVPEWQNQYMDYNALKNLIYTLQTDELHEDEQPVGSSLEQAKPSWKNKFSFRGKKNGSASSVPNANKQFDSSNREDTVLEQTFELKDFEEIDPESLAGPAKVNSPSKMNAFQKVKGKFFDSSRRRSSSGSNFSKKTMVDIQETFVDDLVIERFKVDDFYKRTEAKFYLKFEKLVQDLMKEGLIAPSNDFAAAASTSYSSPENVENNLVVEETFEDDDDDVMENDEFADTPENTALLHHSEFTVKSQTRSFLKQNIINLYIDLSQLKAFIELNKMGFSKITKKADKVLHLNIKAELIQTGEFYKETYIFQKDTSVNLSAKLTQLVQFFAIITNRSEDVALAKQDLKSSLHDHIVWERSNIWKDMQGLLSQDNQLVTDLNVNDPNISLEGKLQLEYFKYPLPKEINLKWTTISSIWIPKLFFTWKAFKIAFIIMATGILLGVKTFNDPAQHRCMALVECVAFLWASEALPLHITAFLVPLLVVLFKVLKDDKTGVVLHAAAASSKILSTMWSSTIIILLAGFTLGEVLAQYNIAKVVASWILAAAGTRPRNVLLVAMSVVFFLSMWISNVAAPVLTYSLLSPVLDTLEADQPFGKALVLGVAIAANIGGMSSPISSPQNIISMAYLKPFDIGWGQFFAIALPTGIIAMLCCWVLLFMTFKINTTKLEKFVPIRTKFTLKQWFIIGVTIATIILWCVESQIESAFGSSGIIAVLPICIFFGTGLLSTHDFNTFPWSIVLLAMGGTALGSAVASSGLLSTIARALQKRILHDTALAVLCIFGALMLVVGTFVSHTVSAIIIIPLVKEIGDKLTDPKAAPLLVFGCALLASAGMGLASSGFPNVTAISMLDKKGNRYLSMGTFISRGVPCSIIVFVCVITIGYGITISVVKPVS